MSRVNSISPDKANSEVKEIYREIEKKLGKIPNIFLNMGNSPAVLKGYAQLEQAANETHLDPKTREQIALVVGESNRCHYCLSAHSVIAKGKGLDEQEIMQARQGKSKDPKSQAILNFTKAVVDNKGKVSNQDVASLKATGISDAELIDIILVIILNMFTNYFNNVTDPKIDFPLAPELK
jgi:uncharacterized peroxidase-related enzyme